MSDVSFRQLGSSGLNVSVVGVGCNNFGFRIDEDATNAVVAAALDAGLNLFDTAASYGASEERLGKALGARRAEVVIATKWPSPFETTKHEPGSRHHIIEACEGSLRRLGTDYIDLYQMHRPDPLTPIDETLARARRPRAVREGALHRQLELRRLADRRRRLDRRARTAGLAWSRRRTSTAWSTGRRERSHPRCAASASGCCRSSRSRAACSRASTSAGPTGPKARGSARAARWRRVRATFLNDRNFDKVEALEKVAAEAGVTLLHLAMEASPRSRRSRRSSPAPRRPSRSRRTSRRARGCLRPTCSPRSTKPRSERVAHVRRAPRGGRAFGRAARRARARGGARRSRADVPRVDGRRARRAPSDGAPVGGCAHAG